MKKTHNKLTCLFGHHDYDDGPMVTVIEKPNKGVKFIINSCKHCGKLPKGWSKEVARIAQVRLSNKRREKENV